MFVLSAGLSSFFASTFFTSYLTSVFGFSTAGATGATGVVVFSSVMVVVSLSLFLSTAFGFGSTPSVTSSSPPSSSCSSTSSSSSSPSSS